MTRVFLIDVDNTLIDNDRAKQDLEREIQRLVGPDRAAAFWSIYEAAREESGVVDFPETLERFRRAFPNEPHASEVDRAVMTVPFEGYLYPRALEVIAHLWTLGTVVILSDGDRVYQPMKIARAGLVLAARGNVFVYAHKEDHLAEVQVRFPAERYVHVDDKASLLARTKERLGDRATTIHVRQGHYATESDAGPPPDITVDRIGDLLEIDPGRFDR
ncbi:MAG TPA: HAD family hydrolase [Candidatus Limnocylindria bacterium]|nr:HAD family hydrolase [Candidatus Limnocylindria bacterium]